jgi:hypothetical protein
VDIVEMKRRDEGRLVRRASSAGCLGHLDCRRLAIYAFGGYLEVSSLMAWLIARSCDRSVDDLALETSLSGSMPAIYNICYDSVSFKPTV